MEPTIVLNNALECLHGLACKPDSVGYRQCSVEHLKTLVEWLEKDGRPPIIDNATSAVATGNTWRTPKFSM